MNCCKDYERFYVSILSGQSNAVGRHHTAYLSAANASFAQPFYGIQYSGTEVVWQTGAVVQYTAPVLQPNANGTMGSELSLGQCLASNPPDGFNPDTDCQILLKFAAGGSGMQAWLPNGTLSSSGHSDRFKAWMQCWKTKLSTQSCEIVCNRFYWVQGEAEAALDVSGVDYVAQFNQLMDFVNDSFGCEFEPVFADLKSNRDVPADPAAQEINDAMAAAGIVTTGSNNDLILVDTIHYDADSLIELGNRLCNA